MPESPVHAGLVGNPDSQAQGPKVHKRRGAGARTSLISEDRPAAAAGDRGTEAPAARMLWWALLQAGSGAGGRRVSPRVSC